MRDKELNDRRTREEQEQAWICVMHGQAPPIPTRAQLETATGMIPLAPMVDSSSSPLVAARAAAASMSSWQSSSSYSHSGSSWTPSYGSMSRGIAMPGLHGAMVKLDKPMRTLAFEHSGAMIRPDSVNMRFPFASAMTKPPMLPMIEAQPQPQPQPAHTLLELLPKRPREDDHPRVHENVSSTASTTSSSQNSASKRACLPKKCDFPMCKNSSRSRGFCYSHGGGRRCRVEGCTNGAVSRDLCKRHGGGRRCRVPGCKSSSESGGLCYSHGGGRRCSLSWCNARAKKGGYCAVHLEHPDATAPPELVDNDNDNDQDKDTESEPVAETKVEAEETGAPAQVVETLLALSKSPEDEAQSPSSPSSTRGKAYALTSILN